ncbi:MAG: rod shape-determining protein RodA [Eubacterium sp.]|nr:rod shape-determining protein RodA [Eubacterium sp.]MCM1214490.1 rod shape-determining protein RodA [Lachnospiraceae bacterium]MCM1241085.1 rod shape-determining protein RodA [Lachnospiraceae bacterium]MCM1304274.1 rod shape-determining protein RodA [Butyrivibrio sp.]MCM1409657.1 rod shape-determining protein RodA [Lachnospiraceae bacterium]
MFKSYRIRDYDFKLVFMILALAIIGIMAIGSAEESLQKRQLAGVAAGAAAMIIISLFNYSAVLKLYWLMYAANIGLLALVLFSGAGDKAKGAQRWLEIGSLRFQPSETAKILLILFFAQFIMKYRKKINTVGFIAIAVILTAIPWVMIYKQPDLSTSIVVIVVFCFVLFAGGISWKLVVGAFAVAIPAVAIVISMALQPDNEILTDYQRGRILAFVDPQEYSTTLAYQQLNSVTAIASGQLEGKGYKNNEITSVKNGNFISEAQTDFIFAVIGEEFGFKGSIVVIILLMGISLECISIARKAKDTAGAVIATGMGGMVAFQSFVNIGVATFILPNTGLPLPFVSYGLTSLMSLFMGMGFVLNVRLQARRAK